MQIENALDALIPSEETLRTYDISQYKQCRDQIKDMQSQVLQCIYQKAAQAYLHGSSQEIAQLHDVLKQLQPIGQHQSLHEAAAIADLIAQHDGVQQQIAEAQQREVRLQLVANLEQKQAHFEACLDAEEFAQAAECLQSLLKFSQSDQGATFPGFHDQCLGQQSSLQQRLEDLVHEAVHSNAPAPPHLVISPAWLTGAGTNALEVWKALQILGCSQAVITSVANELCNHVLVPLLKLHPSQVSYKAQLERQPDDGSYTVSVSYGRQKTLAEEEDHSSVEAATLQCLQAVKQHVFSNDRQLTLELGCGLWPQLSHHYITLCMKPDQQQMTDASQLQNLLSHFSTAEELESAAVKLLHLDDHMAASDSAESPPDISRIHDYAQHCINGAMHAKRMQVVEQARDVVIHDTQLETAVVGEDILLTPEAASSRPDQNSQSLLSAGSFTLTKSTHRVMQLVGGFVQEAVSSGSPAVVQAMCNAVPDIMVIYTQPPPKMQEQLTQVAQLSCLHYNSCQYLAHELCCLPFATRPPLATLIGSNGQFLESIRELRAFGQACLDRQVQRQADEIVGLLGVAQGFRQVTSGQKGIAARRVVAQVLHSLSRLGDALGGILPSQIYVQAAGRVLQAVLQTVIGNLMAINDISVDDSEELPKILGPLVEDGPEAALGRAHQQPGNALSPATNKRQLLQTMKLAAPAIVKLQELLELMDVRLVEIDDRWESGRLQACGFSNQEVIHVVRALFEDTDMRRRVLHNVAST